MNGRRSFIQQLGSILLSPFVFFSFSSLTKRNIKNLNFKEYKLLGKHGIYNFDEVFIRFNDNEISVFSNGCSHCGFPLIAAGENLLCCTRDASKFNGKGEVLQGPASVELVPLQYQFNSESNKIIVFSKDI